MTMQPSYDNPFNGIVEGMPVYDSNGMLIGSVVEIYLGGQEWPDPDEGDPKAATPDIAHADETNLNLSGHERTLSLSDRCNFCRRLPAYPSRSDPIPRSAIQLNPVLRR